jgi:hypothetical protein
MEEQGKKSNKKVYVYLGVGLGIIVLGAGAYWLIFGRDKGANVRDTNNDLFKNLEKETDKPTIPYTPPTPKNTSTYVPKTNSGFPLKKGSKGTLVKQMQEALIKSYGKTILPKWGADGDFGSETKNALISKGFSEVVDEATFNKIVSPAGAEKPAPGANGNTTPPPPQSINNDAAIKIASALITKTKARDGKGIISELQKLKSVNDYSAVNEPFKAFALDGHEQSIVNGVLSAFTDETQRMEIKSEFFRIGLKVKDSIWSLSGLSCALRLMTTCEATIRNAKGCCIVVPVNTIIGTSTGTKGADTIFKTLDGQTLFVPTKNIKHV